MKTMDAAVKIEVTVGIENTFTKNRDTQPGGGLLGSIFTLWRLLDAQIVKSK